MERRVRIVAMGDSTTAGTPGWRSAVEAPPDGEGDPTSQYAWWLMRAHPEWEVLNRGVDGERTDQIAARFDRDVLQAAPAAVVLIAGVNDVYQGRSAADVMEGLETMYRRAEAAGLAVVAGSIIPYNTATPDQNARMRAINEWIRERWRQAPAGLYVDTRAAVARPDHPELLIDSPDDLHPSPEGYRRMADAIAPAVESLLRTRPR